MRGPCVCVTNGTHDKCVWCNSFAVSVRGACPCRIFTDADPRTDTHADHMQKDGLLITVSEFREHERDTAVAKITQTIDHMSYCTCCIGILALNEMANWPFVLNDHTVHKMVQ